MTHNRGVIGLELMNAWATEELDVVGVESGAPAGDAAGWQRVRNRERRSA